MFKFFRLTFLRPVEHFLTQWLLVSTEPTAFVRERIRLGDTTNFLRAARFFLSAISAAFLAEVATLYLLGIGNLTEPYYWLFILLTSIPFVLFCFLLVRLVAPLSLKDVLHLSFYPIGAGVFTGAALALVASAVIGLLVASGYIPEIRYDFTQWGDDEQGLAAFKQALHNCLKKESFIYTILAAGLQETYTNLRPPIDLLSYVRPVIAVLYLGIAARVFMAAVDRRKAVIVLSIVLLAALLATGANVLGLKAYFEWSYDPGCEKDMAERGLDRMAESAAKKLAADLDKHARDINNNFYDASVRSEGRALFYTFRFKRPFEMGGVHSFVSQMQKQRLGGYCSEENWFLRSAKITETHIFFSSEGERLTSFSISPADCPRW